MAPIPVHPPSKGALVSWSVKRVMGDKYLSRFFSHRGSSSKQLTSVKASLLNSHFLLGHLLLAGKESNRPIHAELLMTDNGLLWYPFGLFTFEQKKALTLKVGILSTLECSREMCEDLGLFLALHQLYHINNSLLLALFLAGYKAEDTKNNNHVTRVSILNRP